MKVLESFDDVLVAAAFAEADEFARGFEHGAQLGDLLFEVADPGEESGGFVRLGVALAVFDLSGEVPDRFVEGVAGVDEHHEDHFVGLEENVLGAQTVSFIHCWVPAG